MGFNQIKRINILGLDEPWSAGPKGWRTKEEGSGGKGAFLQINGKGGGDKGERETDWYLYS